MLSIYYYMAGGMLGAEELRVRRLDPCPTELMAVPYPSSHLSIPPQYLLPERYHHYYPSTILCEDLLSRT